MVAAERDGFGALLKHYRAAAALSQDELAERAGLSVKAIGALESGARRTPHWATVRMLADALGLHEQARTTFEAAGHGHRAISAPKSLPLPLTPLIGREQLVSVACSMLQREEV